MQFLLSCLLSFTAVVGVFTAPLCSEKRDGNYPLADPLMYLKCLGGDAILVPCPRHQVYDAKEGRCMAETTANGVTGDITCSGKPDGKYPRRDTYTYLQCTNGYGRVVNCPTNQVYIHRERRCRTVTTADEVTFCEGLPNDDYRNPWNCHMFIKCFSGITYPFNCQRSDLVFDPEKDQCVYSYQYPCIVVGNENNMIEDVACGGKPDGKYPLRDTFTYLQCNNQVGHVVNCPANQVYIHREQRCRIVTVDDKQTFCEGLPNNDYRYPWNCHMFFKCFSGVTYPFNCQLPSLVFNPKNDECVYPKEYECVTVKSSSPPLAVQANRCAGRPDGLYVIADVFSYLECKSCSEIVHNCPSNQIFVAKKMACSSVTTAAEDVFCDARQSGNYRNPWNCHHFISCVTGHPSPYDRPCHPDTLVYDPNNDQCEHANLFPCKNLTSPTPQKNRCTGKPDGLYILADVFKYLECQAGKEILHFCPSKQMFAPDVMACRAVVPADKLTFCNKRPVGNYRNPWNCHHFITCDTGHPIYDRPCHPLSLVYDPDNDLCEHDYLMTCVEV